MTKVRIRENSWIARLAARKLACSQVAMVIGRTIYLHNVSKERFLASRRWVLHELKHVEQFEEHGFLRFLMKYVAEYARKGYYQNMYEVEARMAERDEGLLVKYEIE